MDSVADVLSRIDWTSLSLVVGITLQAFALIVAWRALKTARNQLIPLRQDIERIAASQAKITRLRNELVRPGQLVRLAGFDARFTANDWGNILAAGGATQPIQAELNRSYKSFYDRFHSKPPPFEQPTILILGQAYVPEFLARKWIDPLPPELGFEKMMSMRAELRSEGYDEVTAQLGRYLFCDAFGTAGALPLWLNSHGRLITDPQLSFGDKRVSSINSLGELFEGPGAEERLSNAGIQSYHVMLEFWAHLAYRGCRLFRPSPNFTTTFSSELLSSDDELRRFAQATADLATRLHFSSQTKAIYRSAKSKKDLKQAPKFKIGHSEDARMLREGLALWKPAFSSELLWKLARRKNDPVIRLANDTEFRPPYFRHDGGDDWSYLSALSGYGLALPAGASKNPDCISAAKNVFLLNPAMLHPYLADMVGDDPTADTVDDFALRHARPRWPFWHRAERKLSDAVFDLLLDLNREGNRTPQEFWEEAVQSVSLSRDRLSCLFDQIAEIASDHDPPWAFEY
jgi:hypothetical protein